MIDQIDRLIDVRPALARPDGLTHSLTHSLVLCSFARFSHATMPLFNLVKNCTYYWLFALYVAYFVNHPLYTAPGVTQTVVCLVGALACQLVGY